MLTGKIRTDIDKLWEKFWTGGITNPLTVIEQISYLMFARMLDMQEDVAERKANRTGNAFDRIWQRLYHAGRDSEYGISRYGLNSFAEVVGWARPEVVPPRNGRTSKALRALGFSVKIY